MLRATELAHLVLRQVLVPGAYVVDATVGNGHDTLLLAQHVGSSGQVFGFDVQQSALAAAALRLQGLPQVTLFHSGHERLAERLPPEAKDRLAAVMARKANYGSLNHFQQRLGKNRINDLFDTPDLFQKLLRSSKWIAPGDPDQSQFLKHLTTFQGPMYQIFDAADLSVWRSWIEWLGREKNLSPEDAYVLCSLAADLKITQIVDAPNWGVSAYLSLSVFTD